MTDFPTERQHLHEFIFPELQRVCAGLGLDLLVVDPNWRYGSAYDSSDQSQETSASATDELLDPLDFELQLEEIEHSHDQSVDVFLLVSISMFDLNFLSQ